MSILSRDRRGPMIRSHVGDLSRVPRLVTDEGDLRDAIATLYRQGDQDLIRSAMIDRYAQTIERTTDPTTGAAVSTLTGSGYRRVNDTAVKAAILGGQYETIRLQLFDSIIRGSATLFGQPRERWVYDPDTLADTMDELRADSDAGIAEARCDALACACGSALLYLSVEDGRLIEAPVSPNNFFWAHADTITDDEGNERSTNTASLDEASVVVLQLAATGDKGRWVAWFGPSAKYPLGRNCIYTAREWSSIPDPGTDGCLDYTEAQRYEVAGAGMANPLSLWASKQRDWSLPTYPFAILVYDALSSGMLPTSASLYQECREIDLMGSIVIGAAGRGARGHRVLKRTDGGNIPENPDEGLTVLGRGQELSELGWSPTHAEAAMRVINQTARHIAEAHHVPGFLVTADDVATMPSGVALELMLSPQRQFRAQRANINKRGVMRRFEIERALVNATLGTTAIPTDAVEEWIPGEPVIPRDPTMVVAAWQARIAAGEANVVDMVQDMRGLETYEAAVEFVRVRKAEMDNEPELFGAKPAPAAEPEQPLFIRPSERVRAGAFRRPQNVQ